MPDIAAPAGGDSLTARFANDGIVGPFRLGSPGQMRFVAFTLTRSVLPTPGSMADDPFTNRHLDSPMVAQLCTHPAIIEQVEPLLGPDLVVWRSLFFSKGPGSKDVAWHQDAHFWKLDPPITITAWIAIDRAQSADHCMQVIPGSHKKSLRHFPSGQGSQFPATADLDQADLSRAVEVPVDAGMFVLFDQRLAHRSSPGGVSRRLALSVRIAPAYVKIDAGLLPADGRVLPMRRNFGSEPLVRSGPVVHTAAPSE